jgi:ABC-type branched-subunit amino acid transport system substrate-binding protein
LAASELAVAQVKVGVMATLSGPLANEGRLAVDVIEKILRSDRQITLVVHDDQGNPELASLIAEKMQMEKVAVVIGPSSTVLTAAAAPRFAPSQIPVISLAAPSRTRLVGLAERHQRLIMFSPMSGVYIDAVGKYMQQSGRRQVGFVHFNPGAADYSEEFSAQLGRTAGQFEPVLKVPVATSADVERLGEQLRPYSKALIVGTVAELVANELATKAGRNLPNPMILFAPPSIATKASFAASVVFEAAKGGARTPEQFFQRIQGSKQFQRETRTLALDWTVVTYGLGPQSTRDFKMTAAETTSCSCASKDGKVCKQKSCATGQRCRKDEQDDTCTVECVQ